MTLGDQNPHCPSAELCGRGAGPAPEDAAWWASVPLSQGSDGPVVMRLPLGARAQAAPPRFGLGDGGARGHQHHWLRTVQGQPLPVGFPPKARSSQGIRAQARGFCINSDESEINNLGARSIRDRTAKERSTCPAFSGPRHVRGGWRSGLQGGVLSCSAPPGPATPCLPPLAAPWGSCYKR